MIIERIDIQGFRGFNEYRSIDIHEKLTLIYAPNSYGKTSITESLEWLLYGQTSKVAEADYLEEYKGSYRNVHFPASSQPCVKVNFIDKAGCELEYKALLTDKDSIERFINNTPVSDWALNKEFNDSPKPFVLQHVLKSLMLAKPIERFHKFASILGLELLEGFQQQVINLCTSPKSSLPSDLQKYLNSLQTLESKISRSSLSGIYNLFNKRDFTKTFEEINNVCLDYVPGDTEDDNILTQLIEARETATEKVFNGNVRLNGFSEAEIQQNRNDEKYINESVGNAFLQKYQEIKSLASILKMTSLKEFFEKGVKLLESSPTICPFCKQEIDEEIHKNIHESFENLIARENEFSELITKEKESKQTLDNLENRLNTFHNRNIKEKDKIKKVSDNLIELEKIIKTDHSALYESIATSIDNISKSVKSIIKSYGSLFESINTVKNSVIQRREDIDLLTKMKEEIIKYFEEIKRFENLSSKEVIKLNEADLQLQDVLDKIAGTENISLLIELIQKQDEINKIFAIENLLENLKVLRKDIDNYVSSKVLESISTNISKSVMDWYNLIKTDKDPVVHFSGFDIERKKDGDLKSRKVSIKANSYDKELVSAVSSLSESKLNALGLCINIATNMTENSIFDFLVIDDPIQSWDKEHEIHFIEILKKLIELDKQVILLSHNRHWIERVRKGCRDINGFYYEITGYNRNGPNIMECNWENYKQRLDDVDAIIKNVSSSTIKLEQAEEEMRMVYAELTSDVYYKITGIRKKPSKLKSADIRKMLLECDVTGNLVNNITLAFQTINEAHHDSDEYTPERENIKKYHSWAYELSNYLN